MVVGRLNKQIGRELGVSEKTVKVHRARVMSKMKVRRIPPGDHSVWIGPPTAELLKPQSPLPLDPQNVGAGHRHRDSDNGLRVAAVPAGADAR